MKLGHLIVIDGFVVFGRKKRYQVRVPTLLVKAKQTQKHRTAMIGVTNSLITISRRVTTK
jgi:hypothetical protein